MKSEETPNELTEKEWQAIATTLRQEVTTLAKENATFKVEVSSLRRSNASLAERLELAERSIGASLVEAIHTVLERSKQ